MKQRRSLRIPKEYDGEEHLFMESVKVDIFLELLFCLSR